MGGVFKKMKYGILLIMLILMTPYVFGDTIASNAVSGTVFEWGCNGGILKEEAQQFVIDSQDRNITSISMEVNAISNSPTGNYWMTIEGGTTTPNGTVYDTSEVVSGSTLSVGVNVFNFSSGIKFDGNSSVWFTMQTDEVCGGTDYIQTILSVANPYANGTAAIS